MFVVKIVNISNQNVTHGQVVEQRSEALSWINFNLTLPICPWGSLKEILVSEASELELEIGISNNGETIIVPDSFVITIEDKTAEFALQAEIEQDILQGEIDKAKCQRALLYINGSNRRRQLTAEQITIMQTTFNNVFLLLLANRPDSAALVINSIDVDGVIVTQELKDIVLMILNEG